jgi:hypothetical protein
MEVSGHFERERQIYPLEWIYGINRIGYCWVGTTPSMNTLEKQGDENKSSPSVGKRTTFQSSNPWPNHSMDLKQLSCFWNTITVVLISPQPDLLPDVFCLMVRIFRLTLVLFYIYIYIYIYIYSTNIPPIMVINRMYEHQNLLSL